MRYLILIAVLLVGGCAARELPQGNKYADVFEILDLTDLVEKSKELAR